MWRQLSVAARSGAFVGMLGALGSLLFFLCCPLIPDARHLGWISAHGSHEFIRAAQADFDEKYHLTGHTLEDFDYVRWHINKYNPPSEVMRIPFAVFTVPLVLTGICVAIPVIVFFSAGLCLHHLTEDCLLVSSKYYLVTKAASLHKHRISHPGLPS